MTPIVMALENGLQKPLFSKVDTVSFKSIVITSVEEVRDVGQCTLSITVQLGKRICLGIIGLLTLLFSNSLDSLILHYAQSMTLMLRQICLKSLKPKFHEVVV